MQSHVSASYHPVSVEIIDRNSHKQDDNYPNVGI